MLDRADLCMRSAAAAFAIALAGFPSELEAGQPQDEGRIETIIVRGDEIRCRIKEFDENYVWIIQIIEGVELEPMRLPWSVLDGGTIRRLRGDGKTASAIEKLLNNGSEDAVEALRVRLKNGSVFVGLELKERSDGDYLVLRTRNIPEARYPRKDIESTEAVMLPMEDFYSKEEMYHLKKAERNPDTAREHVALAEEMMRSRNWTRALEHFERACILDEDLVESTRERVAAARAARMAEAVDDLDGKIQADYRAERWKEALDRIDQLSAFDPDSPIRTRWDAKRDEVVARLQKDLRRQIVSSYYSVMNDLLKKRAYGRASDGEIPGVVVTMKSGEVVTGTLASEDQEFVSVQSEGKTIRIARSLVSDVRSVDLSQKTRSPSFAELKAYACGASGGVTGDILAELERQYGKYGTKELPVSRQSIKEFWDNRLTWVITYTERGVVKTDRVYSYHEADYGGGSWLREGSASIAPVAVRRGSRNNPAAEGIETNPDKWWQGQPFDARAGILLAIAAEALCDVQDVIQRPCPGCGASGVTRYVGNTGAGSVKICPLCRGMKTLVKIRYR